MLRYGYFDSEITGYDSDGMPIFDRAENSELFAAVWSNLIRDGVMSEPSDGFSVSMDTGMSVKVSKGFAVIRGHFAWLTSEQTLTVSEANPLYPRVDRVLLRLSYPDRMITLAIREGEATSDAKAPSLVRDDDIYELGLALIRIEAGSSEVKLSGISDTRADSSICGIIEALGAFSGGDIRLKVPYQDGALFYNGVLQSPKWVGYDDDMIKLSGDTEGLDVGMYTAYFKPKDGYCWADRSRINVGVDWRIGKAIPNLSLSANEYAFI